MYGERIRKLRESLRLTRTDFAVAIGSTAMKIYQWEEESSEPTITDLIIMAAKFETSVDWLVGAAEDYNIYDGGNEYEEEDDESNCDECEDFLHCKLIPHMQKYAENNEDAAYIHIQLATDGDDEDCIIFSGRAQSILSAINILIKSLADKSKTDYHEIIGMMTDSFDHTDWEEPEEDE